MMAKIENNFQKKIVETAIHGSDGTPKISSRIHSYLSDNYYTKEMNKMPFGFGPFTAVTETAAASSLVWCFPGPATWVNLLTTVGEYVKTWVAGTDKFGDPNDEKVKANREGAMAWLQIFAGAGGLVGTLWGKISNSDNDVEEVPLFKKAILSAASGINALFMFFGAGEKTLLSTLSENGDLKDIKGREYKNIIIDGHSDMRCSVEWAVMSLVPWISNTKLLKDVVDLGVIYGALREGVDYFLQENKLSFVLENLKEHPVLNKAFKTFTNPLSLFKADNNNFKRMTSAVCFPFNCFLKWFLGTEKDKDGPGMGGFRNNRLVPLLELFGCNPPKCYLDDNKNIISSFSLNEDEYEKAKSDLNNNKMIERNISEIEIPYAQKPIIEKTPVGILQTALT